MLVVDFDAPSNFRALARYDEKAVERIVASGGEADILGSGHLAFTIEAGSLASRYQGVIALEGQGLEQAAHAYFERSEQIPTVVRLAVGQNVTPARRAMAGGRPARAVPARFARAAPAGRPASRRRARGRDARGLARGRRMGRGQIARGDDRGSRADRSDAVERTAAVPPVQRARRSRLRSDAACRGLPLLGRQDRRDAAELLAGGARRR